MGSIILRIVVASLCCLPISYAKDKTAQDKTRQKQTKTVDASNTPLSKSANIRNTVEFFKRFDTAEEAYQTMSALVPNLGLDRWLQYFKTKNVDLKKLTFEDIRVEANRVFLPKLKTPFVFLNDRKISYKGVDFKFSKDQSPEQNVDRLKKAWGGNAELGLNSSSKTSLWRFYLENARADEDNSRADEDNSRADAVWPLIALYNLFWGDTGVSGASPSVLKDQKPILICNDDKTFNKIIDNSTKSEIPLDKFYLVYRDEKNAKLQLASVCRQGVLGQNVWSGAIVRALDSEYEVKMPVKAKSNGNEK